MITCACLMPGNSLQADTILILSLPPYAHTQTHTYTHAWYILIDGANNYLVKNAK